MYTPWIAAQMAKNYKGDDSSTARAARRDVEKYRKDSEEFQKKLKESKGKNDILKLIKKLL
jgi:hypothetical protein